MKFNEIWNMLQEEPDTFLDAYDKYLKEVDKCDCDDEHGCYSCFTGSDFIEWLMKRKCENKCKRDSIEITDEEEFISFILSQDNGVYSAYLVNSAECHCFIFSLKNDRIKIINNYGGYRDFYMVNEDRYDYALLWFNDLENEEEYARLWNFEEHMISGARIFNSLHRRGLESVTFESITIQRIE